MAIVAMEATIQAEAQTKPLLGRIMGFSTSIVNPRSPNPSFGPPPRGPKPLVIDEGKISVGKVED